MACGSRHFDFAASSPSPSRSCQLLGRDHQALDRLAADDVLLNDLVDVGEVTRPYQVASG
jgi:hypothetical protein